MDDFKCKCGETSHAVLITIANEEVICESCVKKIIQNLGFKCSELQFKLEEIQSILNN